ncbi:heterokaryon incompatibility protein-domain-containing protein [Xylaria acuta]|nr:heterokaryon incompatibility protein-domain-containing protein [Xylaria acuta]
MAFPYPPLPDEDALRLLTLKAGEFFDPLEGDLVPVGFSAKPKYLALSYTWGDPTPEQPDLPATFTKQVVDSDSDSHEPAKCGREATLALNGHDVPIGHNLALALRYLRSASHPLTLWVDAVCINQADIDERNAQVALMALIYSRAAAVVTWLGLNGPEVVGALTFDQDGGIRASMAMRDVYNLGNSKELAPWFAEYVATGSSANARNLVESRAAEKEKLERIAAVNQLGDTMVMMSNYWQRVWVVQEVCLAQKVLFVYGPTLLVNEEVLQSAHQMNRLKVVSGMKNMLEARRVRFTEAMRLEKLIEEFAGQMCTDPRDKIYGLVGLANDISAVESPGVAKTDRDNGVDGASIQYNGDEDVEFVIDYRRSFWNIWCDVVKYLFQCPYYFVPPHLDMDEGELARLRHLRLTNLVRFAGLVQNTLQDEVERELAQLAPSSSASEIDAQLRGPSLFGRQLVPARGYLAGKILDLGPSYADFVSSFRYQTAWRTKWRKHYRKENDLWQLREMEERYAAKILEYDEADVARIARIDGGSFIAFRSPDDGPLDKLTAAPTNTDDIQAIDDLLMSLSIKATPEIEPGGKVCRFLGTDHCMGLAPPGAAAGDWVIRFWDCDAAIVVRPDGVSDPVRSCALIGRADVADLRDRKGPHGDIVASEALKRDLYNNDEDKRVDVLMHWHTLQLITASIAT